MKEPFVLLVNPWVTDFALYDLWSKPLGLLFLASLLRENGIRVEIIDCMERIPHEIVKSYTGYIPSKDGFYGTGKFPKKPVEIPTAYGNFPRRYFRYGIPDELFLEKMGNISDIPDIIWVTSIMTYWYPGVVETIKKLKSVWPHVPIWLGGTYARLCRDHAVLYSGANRVITSTAEVLPELLEEALNVRLLNSHRWKDFALFPSPSWDLLPPIPYIVLLVGVGCPFRCAYCASSILYPKFFVRPPHVIYEEILNGVDRGIRDFAFYDDALLVTSWHSVKEVLKRVVTDGINIRFHTPNALHVRAFLSSDEKPEEILLLLKASGFTTIRLGFETAHRKHQKQWGGKIYCREFEEAVKRLFEFGWETKDVGAYILCGVPWQTLQEVRDSIDFVASLGVLPFLSEYSPIPGTHLWNIACSSSPFNIQNEPLYHNNSFFACRTSRLSYEEMISLKNYALYVRRMLASTSNASSSLRSSAS